MAYKDLTFEQYAKEVYKICKEKYAVVKSYPKEFEETFKDYKLRLMEQDYNENYSPESVASTIAIMV